MELVQARLVTVADLESDGVVEVRNPARTDELVGTYPRIGPAAVDAVVGVAGRAQPAWAALSPEQRFDRLAVALKSINVEGLDRVLTREHGKVLAESARELRYLSFPASFLRDHVQWLAEGEDLGDSGGHRSRVYRDPFGVVGVILPWNVPVGTSLITIPSALLAGNVVVAHLPPTAPLVALEIFGQLAAALPDGVLSLISSPNVSVAQSLVEHPLIRHVHFTGSTAVGTLVAREASANLTTTTLELGGNDAAIVLADALEDPGIYQRIYSAAFGACGGQACVALKRLYVPAERVDEVVEGLGCLLDAVVVGDGLEPGTTTGPMHTAVLRDRIRGLVDAARAAGGRVHEFGTLTGDPDRGHFLLPTVVSGLSHTDALVREEQFGPALPVIGYATVDDAIAQANDSEYGLGSSVWSPDLDRAQAIARRLQAGMTWINAHAGAGIDGRVPWGGVKHSGVGRVGANRAGLEAFTEPHAVVLSGTLGV